MVDRTGEDWVLLKASNRAYQHIDTNHRASQHGFNRVKHPKQGFQNGFSKASPDKRLNPLQGIHSPHKKGKKKR